MDQRDWEDALFSAEDAGLIDAPAVLMGLRLSRAIEWGDHPVVRWHGERLLEAMKTGRTQFYGHRKSLSAAGLLTVDGQNLLPTSPAERTTSPADRTDSPAERTDRPADRTYMEVVVGGSATHTPSLRLTAATTPNEIAATFDPGTHFPQWAAAVFVAACIPRWPESTRPNFSALVRLITKAQTQHSDKDIWLGMQDWFDEKSGTEMHSPAAVFSSQCEDFFSTHQTEAAR